MMLNIISLRRRAHPPIFGCTHDHKKPWAWAPNLKLWIILSLVVLYVTQLFPKLKQKAGLYTSEGVYHSVTWIMLDDLDRIEASHKPTNEELVQHFCCFIILWKTFFWTRDRGLCSSKSRSFLSDLTRRLSNVSWSRRWRILTAQSVSSWWGGSCKDVQLTNKK